MRPNLGTVEAREEHHCTGEDETLCGTVEVPEIQRVRVVCFPGGEEHGKTWD